MSTLNQSWSTFEKSRWIPTPTSNKKRFAHTKIRAATLKPMAEFLLNFSHNNSGPAIAILDLHTQSSCGSYSKLGFLSADAVPSNELLEKYNSLIFNYGTYEEISYLLVGFTSGIIITIILNSLQKHQYREVIKLKSKREALALLGSLDKSEIQNLVRELPAWLAFRDIERTDWINKVVAASWPYLDEATSNIIRKTLDPILQSTRPTFLTTLQFERFSFGSVPAKIEGVKVYETEGEGALEIDLDVFWAGDPDVVLGVRAAQDTLSVPVSLTELQCSFTLRLIFAPLIGVFPCFGAITIALVDYPRLKFDLRVVGGDITIFPGLAQPLRAYIKALITSYLIWPRSITIPIPGTGYSLPTTNVNMKQSVLYITVLSIGTTSSMTGHLSLEVHWPTIISKDACQKRMQISSEGLAGKNRKFSFSVEDPHSQVFTLQWHEETVLKNSSAFDTASTKMVTSEASILLADLFCKPKSGSQMVENEITVGVELQSSKNMSSPVFETVQRKNDNSQLAKIYIRKIWDGMRKNMGKLTKNNRMVQSGMSNDELSQIKSNIESAKKDPEALSDKNYHIVQIRLLYEPCNERN
jgi:hypothetical protein